MADPAALLPFAQIDLPGALPLGDGRYLVRPLGQPGADPDVLVLRVLGAPRSRSRLRRGRAVPLETEPEATPLPLTRITLIRAIRFEDERAAASWLERVSREDELADGLIAETLETVNRALLAYRVSAPDPYAADLGHRVAVAIRFGYGTGQQVAEGRWSAALQLPDQRRRSVRAEVIDSVGAQERIAAVLGGHDSVAPAESLLIDAERAAAQGRSALAALTIALALEALRAGGGDPGEAGEPARGLRERALRGAEISTPTLDQTLRLARRAIRAG